MTTTTILSDNGVSSGTAGIKTTGGNDGTLALQTTTSGGTATTAISIDNNQAVTIQGLTVGKGAGSIATNTAVGYQAGYGNTTGVEFTAIGYQAGKSNTTGAGNTLIGASAGFTNSTSSNNTIIGDGTGYGTTGGNNTFVGTSAAANQTTGTNNTVIGYQAGNSSSVINLTTQSNRVVIGDANVTNAYILVAWTVTSDARDKADVSDSTYGLDFVNELRPVTYKWDKRANYDNQSPDGTHKETKTQLGFLAQEVIALEKKYGGVDKDLLIADDETDESLKITETKMIPVLVKAIQELNAKIIALENKQ